MCCALIYRVLLQRYGIARMRAILQQAIISNTGNMFIVLPHNNDSYVLLWIQLSRQQISLSCLQRTTQLSNRTFFQRQCSVLRSKQCSYQMFSPNATSSTRNGEFVLRGPFGPNQVPKCRSKSFCADVSFMVLERQCIFLLKSCVLFIGMRSYPIRRRNF